MCRLRRFFASLPPLCPFSSIRRHGIYSSFVDRLFGDQCCRRPGVARQRRTGGGGWELVGGAPSQGGGGGIRPVFDADIDIGVHGGPAPQEQQARRGLLTSSSTAASWLAPAVAPAELTAELAAIQEGDRSPAPTTVADEEVINFGAMQRHWATRPSSWWMSAAPSARTSADQETAAPTPAACSGAAGGHGGAVGTTSAPTATTSSATAFLAAAGGDGSTTSAPTTTSPTPVPAKAGFLAAYNDDEGPTMAQRRSRSQRRCRRTHRRSRSQRLRPPRSAGTTSTRRPRPMVPAEVLMAKRPPTELRQPGPEPAPAQRSNLGGAAATDRRRDVQCGAGHRQLGRAGDGGGLGNFPSPEEARSKPAHRHDRHGPLLLTGPAAAAGSTSSSSSTTAPPPTSTALQIPPPLQVVDEEDSDDDLPEGFDMRPERPGGVRFNMAVFVPDIDWPAYKRRMEGRGAWANAFFIRRLPSDQRGGRIPRKHANRRVAGWCGLGVSNGHTGHACPADHDHLAHFAGR